MDTTTRRPNQDTPARWQTALARAVAGGVAVYQEDSTGMLVVTSATKPGVVYVTDGQTCTCPAGVAGDPVCLHRAAYLHRTGVLARNPELVAPAVEAKTEMADDDWAAYWTGRFSQCPAIAPGPITSMSDLDIFTDSRSLPVAGLCPACDGRGDFRKESSIFKGTTFRVGCRACKGSGFARVDIRRRIAA